MRISEMYKDFKLYSILTTGQLYKLRANTGYELDGANSSSNTVLDLSTLNPLSGESYLFVVDNVSQIKGINEWMCYRMLKNDSVMDINGFVQTLAEIQKTQNSREGTKALLFLDIMGASSVKSGIDLLPKISTDGDDYQQEQVLISEKGAYKIVHKTDMLFEVDILNLTLLILE